jgi:hypothetical protein
LASGRDRESHIFLCLDSDHLCMSAHGGGRTVGEPPVEVLEGILGLSGSCAMAVGSEKSTWDSDRKYLRTVLSQVLKGKSNSQYGSAYYLSRLALIVSQYLPTATGVLRSEGGERRPVPMWVWGKADWSGNTLRYGTVVYDDVRIFGEGLSSLVAENHSAAQPVQSERSAVAELHRRKTKRPGPKPGQEFPAKQLRRLWDDGLRKGEIQPDDTIRTIVDWVMRQGLAPDWGRRTIHSWVSRESNARLAEEQRESKAGALEARPTSPNGVE